MVLCWCCSLMPRRSVSSWRHWENFLGSSGWKCSTRYCKHWINFHWTDSTMGADSNSQRSEIKRFISFAKMIQWSIWVEYYTCRIPVYHSLSELELPRRSMDNWNQTGVVLQSCPVQTQGVEVVGVTPLPCLHLGYMHCMYGSMVKEG